MALFNCASVKPITEELTYKSLKNTLTLGLKDGFIRFNFQFCRLIDQIRNNTAAHELDFALLQLKFTFFMVAFIK